MANALAGNRIMFITWIAPDEYAASKLRDTVDDYMEFVRNSTPQEGPMRMIHSFFSEGPEYEMSESWIEGKHPPKTGRVILNLYEIYATEEGLDLAWVEAAEWFPTLAEMLEEFKIEMTVANQLSITYNLWD